MISSIPPNLNPKTPPFSGQQIAWFLRFCFFVKHFDVVKCKLTRIFFVFIASLTGSAMSSSKVGILLGSARQTGNGHALEKWLFQRLKTSGLLSSVDETNTGDISFKIENIYPHAP